MNLLLALTAVTLGQRATVDAEAGFDLLAANVVNADPQANAPGGASELTAAELGLRARVYATAFDRLAHVDIDYMGRQPVFGSSQNTPIHLLYKAEVSVDLLDKLLFIGLGRFLAPSAGLLAVDGLRAQLRLSKLEIQVFGGRRAITSSDASNVDLSVFLPAAGVSFAAAIARARAEIGATYTRDQVVTSPEAVPQSYDALSSYARVSLKPLDWVAVGGEVSMAQRASYVLGPTWNSVSLTTTTADLFYAYAYADVRPLRSLRASYDFHYQQAQLYRQGLQLDANDPTVVAVGFVPQFIDNHVRVKWNPFGLGWLGPELRVRVRPDRDEVRAGGFADLAPAWAKGFCIRASYTYEKMVQSGPTLVPADRSYWSASLGWRGRNLDLSVGASDVERSALPLSGRIYTPYNDTPTQPVDLSPFVLQAERVAFVRAFYGSEFWFAGLDFEQSLTDTSERRVFAQIGARLEKEW